MVVRRLVGGDPDLAADIAQEVWIQIFRALPSYRGDSQFSTWAHRIAVNRTLNALRKTRRLANIETEVQEDSASVEPDHDRTFVAQSIEEAAAKLSPGARAVFMLHDVEGYTHEEIAEELGITAGGSKSQLFKARAKLRKLLAHLVDVTDVGLSGLSSERIPKMSHLSTERLAALVDESPTAAELAHLASCAECARERAAHRNLAELAATESAHIGAPLTSWESLRPIARRRRRDRSRSRFTLPRARVRRPWLQAAAAVLFVAGGMMAGRRTAGAPCCRSERGQRRRLPRAG